MSKSRRLFLRCFLFLVSSVVVGFLYFASPVLWRDRAYATTTRNGTLISSHGKAENFSNRILTIDNGHSQDYADTEKAREAMRLRLMVSKTQIDPIDSDSVKSAIGIPVIKDSSYAALASRPDLGTLQNYAAPDDIPKVRVEAVSCAKLFEGDSKEQQKADSYHKLHLASNFKDKQLFREAQNCAAFVSGRQYLLKPASEEEARFPLAYSILLFHRPEQFERLLRAIYRPQNFYCIHVDRKSSKSVQDAVGAIINCFGNVFLAPEQYDVQWGTFSVLQPELSCMKELLKYKKWKYFINLTGQEFPLKTNWEIVQILKIFNGSNNLEGTVARRNLDRISDKSPPPANITVTKGSVHIVATRKFVHYIIYDEISLRFREWVKNTSIPDETYFTSLNFNPHLHVPGSYLGIPETDTKKNLFITRFKNWGDGPFNWPCAGKRVRMICIFGIRDLPLLARRPELFANKFHLEYEPLALDCLEELHHNNTYLQVLLSPDINRNFYENLDFVRNHL